MYAIRSYYGVADAAAEVGARIRERRAGHQKAGCEKNREQVAVERFESMQHKIHLLATSGVCQAKSMACRDETRVSP